MAYYDQPTHGAVLDVIEQEAEMGFQVSDYDNFKTGKPFRSGQLSIPDNSNNRAILGSLFDADGSNKNRIIENVTYQNDVISLDGSIIITGQSYEDRVNVLTGVFVSGNALLWLDFGDDTMQDVDWSEYNHLLNASNVSDSETEALNSLCVYDLCDRGKFIDDTVVDLIERYPAFNIRTMLLTIFKGYDVKSNFLNETWFSKIYLLFTGTTDLRNSNEWKESALIIGSGNLDLIDNTIYMYGPTVDWDRADDYYAVTFINPGQFDNGLNWDAVNNWYLVPETGTYRFKLNVDGDAFLWDENSGLPTGFIDDKLTKGEEILFQGAMVTICKVNADDTYRHIDTAGNEYGCYHRSCYNKLQKFDVSMIGKDISILSEYGQTKIRFLSDKEGIYCQMFDVDDGWIGNKIRYPKDLNNLYLILTGENIAK